MVLDIVTLLLSRVTIPITRPQHLPPACWGLVPSMLTLRPGAPCRKEFRWQRLARAQLAGRVCGSQCYDMRSTQARHIVLFAAQFWIITAEDTGPLLRWTTLFLSLLVAPIAAIIAG